MAGGDTEVMTVGDTGEGDAEFAARARWPARPQGTGRKREAAARVDQHRTAFGMQDHGRGGAVGPAVAQMRRVLRDARHPMRRQALARRRRPAPARSSRPSSHWHRRVPAPGWRAPSMHRACSAASIILYAASAAATLSAIIVDTRTFDSRVTPAMCGVRIRFGQPGERASLPAAARGRTRRARHRRGGPSAALPPPRPRRRRRRAPC